jgi:hypothetical protein
MPTKREREYYAMGFRDGQRTLQGEERGRRLWTEVEEDMSIDFGPDPRKPKRKLSAWNKYVKANSKKPRFRMRSGKLNLKKLAVAFRKTPAGKKKRR